MVSKPPDSKTQTSKEEVIGGSLGKFSEDFDIEDIDMGDTDADAPGMKSREASGSHFVKDDAEEIVQGMYYMSSRNVSESPECHDFRSSIEYSSAT